MKFKIIAAIVVIVVVLFAIIIGTAARNNADVPVEGQTIEGVVQ